MMVYNLRSIGMSLMQNSGQNGCSVKPAKEVLDISAVSSSTASASSLNTPTRNKVPSSASSNPRLKSYSQQNTNQNHGGYTYVSLMSTFDDNRIQSKHKRQRQSKNSQKMALQNTSVINLDSITDDELDLTTPLHDSVDVEVFNISNNSSPNTSTASTVSGSLLTEEKYVCSVLNCAAQFSSELRLDDHMQLLKHSPCNPCLLARNCTLSSVPICYMCPDCDIEFSTREQCTEHMNRFKHLTFYPPLAIKAYMCPQCLYLFPSLDTCWSHMEQASHHGMSYPFANDYTTEEKLNGPVAVSEELVQDLISKCSKVVYTVQCLECGMLMETPAILKHHMRETRNQHVVAALTETSLVEVFSSYLASFSCNICHRLFSGELKELAKHQCAKRIIGTITENDTQSFAEFVKRCALSIIKSLEPENMPGTSRVARQSPVRDKKIKRLDFNHDATTEFSDVAERRKAQSENLNRCSDRYATGSDNELASGCQSKMRTRQKKKVSGPENQSRPSVEKDQSESSVEVAKVQQSARSNSEYSLRKTDVESDVKSERSAVIIVDTDDGSDETDIDFPPDSGVKRKRRTKTAVKPKNRSSDNLSSEPVIISASPEIRKQNPSQLPESPFFVMNYQPRASGLNSKVLTQGYIVQPNENPTPNVHPLTGRNNQDQSGQSMKSPVKYNLRNRNVIETVTSDEKQDSDSVSPAQDCDESFKNIAQALLHSAGTLPAHAALFTPEIQAKDPQLNRRDRSRSPVENQKAESYQLNSGSFRTNNVYGPHSGLVSNISTQVHLSQPNFGTSLAHQDGTGGCRPAGQLQMVGPLRNHGGNQCSTAIVYPSVTSVVPPVSFNSQLPNIGPLACSQNTANSYSAQSNMRNSRESTYCLPGTSTGVIKKPETSTTRKGSNERMVSTEHLSNMKNIVFLDLDNWPSFFHKLPRCLPDFTFVWGFFGGKNPWFEPNGVAIFREMKRKGFFYLNERCGTTKDAADFAIVLTVGKMDEKLPTDIAFTIMSGDKGFCEVERQMRSAERKVMVVNPHSAAQFSNDMIYALVTSVTDT